MPANSSPSPTWYDILGISRDASAAEVKAAWRAATDKFEPGSGTSQFRLFNEAADVLLDPGRRAAYDAGLVDDGAIATTPEATRSEVPVALSKEAATEPAEVPAGEDELPPPVEADAAPTGTAPTGSGLWGALGRFSVPVVAGVLGVLVALVALCVVLVTGLSTPLGDVRGLHSTVAAADARDEASSVAERALAAVLSYDYRHMEADRDRAARFLTPAYRKQYLKNFDDLLTKGPDGTPGPAVKTQAVVKADVLDTGVVDAESDRVRVIVFVNQSSTKGTAQPTIFQNRVVATMVRQGSSWLVDNLKSY